MGVVIFAEALTVETLDYIHSKFGSGAKLQVYSDPVPANPQVALTTQTLLLEIEYDDPAFQAAFISGKSAVALADGLPISSPGIAGGVASWFRIVDAADVPLQQSDVTGPLGTGTLKMATTTVVAGVNATLVAYTGRLPTGEL